MCSTRSLILNPFNNPFFRHPRQYEFGLYHDFFDLPIAIVCLFLNRYKNRFLSILRPIFQHADDVGIVLQTANNEGVVKRKLEEKIRALEKQQRKLQNRIEELQLENKTLRQEKADLIKRLSQAASLKLRDNNPNIVDLSDEYRPTKLAEMFSELYDNEWTKAFSVLEDAQLSEFEAVSFLLDMVMEAFAFSKEQLEDNWRETSLWYLDEKMPTYDQTKKALKDGRKLRIIKLSERLGQKQIQKVCGVCSESFSKVLVNKDVQDYIKVCVNLCLMMCASDPPVFVQCDGWQPRQFRTDMSDENTDKLTPKDEGTENYIKDSGTTLCNTADSGGAFKAIELTNLNSEKSQTQADVFEGRRLEDKDNFEVNSTQLKPLVHSQQGSRCDVFGPSDLHDKAYEEYDAILRGEENIQEVQPNKDKLNEVESTHIKYQRILFSKDKFKDYTKRGKFQLFPVWPALFLYEDGPLLNKGVAQGTNEEFGDESYAAAKWWK